MKKKILSGVIIASMVLVAMPVQADSEKEGKDIMAKVLDRYDGDTQLSTIFLGTCSFILDKEGKPRCDSNMRKKKLNSIAKDYGESLKDTRALTLILEPTAERGIGVLQYDYEAKNKEPDQWMYLPELRQVKRIATSDDTPKKGSLFGSEFSMEDMEKLKLEEYQYKVVKKDDLYGRPVTLVKVTPTDKRAPKTNYSKRIYWVDNERSIILKTEFYGWNNQLIKTNTIAKVEKINNIWTLIKQVMVNHQTRRISILKLDDIVYNRKVSDDILTQRVLSDRVFRESKLKLLQVSKAD